MIEQLQKIEPQRDQLGYWIHPTLNHFYEQIAQGADGLTKTQMEQLEKLINHKISIVEIWNQISDEDATRLEKGDMDVISEWQPKPPNDKAFLVSIHDTDDGTVAWWATPQTINDKCVGVEKARQEMKRQAFEGYFKNTEIYNRECHLRKADILETWSEHLSYYSNIIAHESLLMWQAAQEQMLQASTWNDYSVISPAIEGRYQIFINGEQLAADWIDKFGFADPLEGDALRQDLITHWQPLPQPPKQ